MYIDLRPPQVNRRLERRRLLRLCGWTWSTAALIGLISLGVQYREVRANADFAAARLTNAQKLQTVERRIELLQSELSGDEVRLAKLQSLIPTDRSLTAIAVLAESVRISSGRVVVTALDFTDRLTVKSSSADSPEIDVPSEVQSSSMSIAAVAADDSSIAEFIQSLECQSFFTKLKLTSAETIPLPGGPAKEFDVECEW